MINPETNIVEEVFESTAAANTYLSISYSDCRVSRACCGEIPKFQGHCWQFVSPYFIYSRPIIATDISTGEKSKFDSVCQASNCLFSESFDYFKFISTACKQGTPLNGYLFEYKSEDYGFEHGDCFKETKTPMGVG